MQIVVHYHEIALKGNNRNLFVKRLVSNLRKTFRDMGKISVRTLYGRITFNLDSEDLEEVRRRMGGVFGVANYALVYEVPQDLEAMKKAAWKCFCEAEGKTFAVRCRRPDKSFPMRSGEVERTVGGYIGDRAKDIGREMKVDLTNPDITIRLEIVNNLVLVSGERIKGPGGLPVGTAGKIVGLLSSGFDSPVACWSMMKRGADVIMCHFHSYPFTNKASLENCTLLADILTRFQYKTKLYLVSFAPVQEELLSMTPADLRMILYRRSMVRIASLVAEREGAQALLTGESLGQVASQTLTNMRVIDEAAKMPMLRPLVGTDKEDILKISRNIGTYELSARPYEDCCSLMLSKHPCTKARLREVLELESHMELAELEAKAVEKAEILELRWNGKEVEHTQLQAPVYKDGEWGCPLDLGQE